LLKLLVSKVILANKSFTNLICAFSFLIGPCNPLTSHTLTKGVSDDDDCSNSLAKAFNNVAVCFSILSVAGALKVDALLEFDLTVKLYKNAYIKLLWFLIDS
jgi:hypothetical protein